MGWGRSWSPLGSGLLGGALQKANAGQRSSEQAQKNVEQLCQELGEQPVDVALAWLLHNPVTTFPYAEGLIMDAAPLTLPQLLEQNPLFESMSVDEATYLRSVGKQRTLAAGEQAITSGSYHRHSHRVSRLLKSYTAHYKRDDHRARSLAVGSVRSESDAIIPTAVQYLVPYTQVRRAAHRDLLRRR